MSTITNVSNVATISQGLRRIKKLKGKMAELTARARECVCYEADQAPTFDFDTVRKDMATTRNELIKLEAAVARANATMEIIFGEERMPLAEAIRRLQETKAEIAFLRELPIRESIEKRQEDGWDHSIGRSLRNVTTVMWKTHMSKLTRVQEIEALNERFEVLNNAVEEANHRTRLS